MLLCLSLNQYANSCFALKFASLKFPTKLTSFCGIMDSYFGLHFYLDIVSAFLRASGHYICSLQRLICCNHFMLYFYFNNI